jgi:hypothetical protein
MNNLVFIHEEPPLPTFSICEERELVMKNNA